MPIQRSVTIRDGLMEEIGRVKSLPPDNNANRKTLNEQLEKIEKELQSRRNMFPVERASLAELVIQKFDALEQDVADDKVDGYNPAEMEFKIQRMNENLERLKKILDVSAEFYSQSQSSTASTSKRKQQQKQQQQNQQPTTNHWWQKDIEKNILESGAMTQLQRSYHNLKDRLKLCLLCFSVFPINSKIKKRPLIYWWIGEGFVTQANPKTAEMVGEDVLEELQEKGMIKPWRKPGAPRVSSYTMHPWIHRMVISVARTAGFFDFDDNGKVTSNTGHRSRRVCFVSESRRDQAADSHNNSFTMFNVNEPYLDIELNWFSRQERVRVLQLGRWQNSVTHHIEVVNTKFLLGLGAQKHLQYLSLRGLSRITELPETVAKLTAVRILDLRACHNLEKLPSGIKAMKMLTHLDVSECYLLEQMPKGLDGLFHLQVLKGFVIGRSNDSCKLRDLAVLETLRKLSMIVGRDASIAEDELEHFPKLQILTITWGATEFKSSLKLPRELEKLDLRCFPESDPPTSWLKPSVLMNLKRLYISGGKLANLRKAETGNWKVAILRLKFLKDLVMEWSSLQRDFPDLVYLQQKQCDKLNFTECDGNGVWERASLNPSSPPTTILPKDSGADPSSNVPSSSNVRS